MKLKVFKQLYPGTNSNGSGSIYSLMKKVKRVLMWVLIAETAFFCTLLIFQRPSMIAMNVEPESNPAGQSQSFPPQLKNMASYVAVGNRSLFKRLTKEPIRSFPGQIKTRSNDRNIEQTLKNLRLTGVLMGSKPEAIIEDILTKRTYTVSKNESFLGLTVISVGKDKVDLEYNNQAYQLKL